jgi:hypothetical protein
MGAREYYDYRRAIYGDITHKAILVDAAGTLLAPTEPMAQVRSARPRLPSIADARARLPPVRVLCCTMPGRLPAACVVRWFPYAISGHR